MNEELIRDLITYGLAYFIGYRTSSLVRRLNEKARQVKK